MKKTISPTVSQVQRLFLTYSQKFMKWAFVTTPGSEPLVRSYLFLRRGIGIISMLLPFVLVVATMLLNRSFEVLDSISSYYYSVTRDVFVGSLWAIGIFLICYQYDHLDNILSTIAGACAICLSVFPTPPDVGPITPHQETIGMLHFTFATGFLVILCLMAFFLFTRGNPETEADKKQMQRNNRIYRGCSILMAVCLLIGALLFFVPDLSNYEWQHHYHPILILEFIATEAFGVAWFVKGQTYDVLKAAIRQLPLSLR